MPQLSHVGMAATGKNEHPWLRGCYCPGWWDCGNVCSGSVSLSHHSHSQIFLSFGPRTEKDSFSSPGLGAGFLKPVEKPSGLLAVPASLVSRVKQANFPFPLIAGSSVSQEKMKKGESGCNLALEAAR